MVVFYELVTSHAWLTQLFKTVAVTDKDVFQFNKGFLQFYPLLRWEGGGVLPFHRHFAVLREKSMISLS